MRGRLDFLKIFLIIRVEKDPSKSFDVKIEAIWTTNLPYFNFDTEIHPKPLAKAIAMV